MDEARTFQETGTVNKDQCEVPFVKKSTQVISKHDQLQHDDQSTRMNEFQENKEVILEISEDQKRKSEVIIQDLNQCLKLSKGIIGKYNLKDFDGIDLNCFQYIKREVMKGNVCAELTFDEKKRLITILII